MKKAFVLLGAISMSAMLSACHMMGDDNSQKSDMAQRQDWDAKHAEHMEHMKMMTQHMFDKMDANHDGEVSMKEFMDFQRKKFREADTDHNGYLTQDEMNAQMMKEMKKMKAWKHDHKDGMMNDGMHNGDTYNGDTHTRDMRNGDVHSYSDNPNNSMRDDTMSDVERSR